MRMKSGEIRNFLISGEVVSIGGEEFLLLLSADVTDKIKVEEARRESQKQYQTILDNIPEMIIIHQAGKIVYINPEVTRLGGYKPEDIIGRTLDKYVEKKYMAKVQESVKRRLAGERVADYDIGIKIKSGEIITVTVRAVPITYNNKISLLTALSDVSERKRSEEVIKKSAEELVQKVEELERFKKLTIGRELKMVELKEDIARLKKRG